MEREIVVKKVGAAGWAVVLDDGLDLSLHATSSAALDEAFRWSERSNPPIKITIDCRGE